VVNRRRAHTGFPVKWVIAVEGRAEREGVRGSSIFRARAHRVSGETGSQRGPGRGMGQGMSETILETDTHRVSGEILQ
jgi:hypothetical protein